MRAGRFRQIVGLQRAAGAVDGFGEVVQSDASWGTVATFPAFIRGLSAREAERASQMQVVADRSVSIRRPGIGAVGIPTTKDRFLWGARILNIVEVLNIDERNRELQILCLEMVVGS